MTDAIAHRGPDGEGHWIDGTSGSGTAAWPSSICRRRGTSRWSTPTAGSSSAYNGEVYNFRELRAELEALGYRFRSQQRHRGRAARAGGMGRGGAAPLQRHVRVRAVGPAGAARCCWRATATASSRCTTRSRDDASRSAPSTRRSWQSRASNGSSTSRRCSSTSPSRTSSPTARCSRTCRCCPRGTTRCSPARRREPALETTRYWDFHFREPERAGRRARVPRGAATGCSGRR